MSKYVAEMKIGDKIDVRGPKGMFLYTPNMCREIGMIAGGTGITPMLQVARAIFGNPEDKTKVSLIFANVNEEDILLKDQLTEMSKNPNFKVYYVLNNVILSVGSVSAHHHYVLASERMEGRCRVRDCRHDQGTFACASQGREGADLWSTAHGQGDASTLRVSWF